ncbi:heat-inducible transcription repressor [Spiroplasma sabaudiense Ar-1343]|uniref:Heat-inducible transcription repressor HrcA n=1 Tax=Spiroplasma sabaudiense Ar-1343 TaxID=1276257 RepID=W6AA46_9MOLU|nr:heat-inducible transcriptional repressor HrcA [Spiroplasma sabaudiense]AHI53700.1 heat-inducible transcription repressor [Spiroplasma sabaudiense Ar-1343]
MLTKRQEKILKIIIEEYIRSAQPVGSKKILELINIDVSSATIRNEGAILEEKGFLEKEHTSSGRVPSTIGYRYFVDNLMSKENTDDIKIRLSKIFEQRNANIVDVLDQSCKILSEMTNLASVVTTTPDNGEALLRKAELIPISNESAAVIFALSNGIVENKVFNLENISLEDLQTCINLFNERLVETKIKDLDVKVEAIRPILQQQVKKYEFVLQTFLNVILHNTSSVTKTQGVQYMLENPEFSDPNKIKSVLKLIESISPFEWYKSQTEENEAQVKIGFEIGEENNDLALIGTNFKSPDGFNNAITLIGPKRIQYDKAKELLDWIGIKIKEQFFENKGE